MSDQDFSPENDIRDPIVVLLWVLVNNPFRVFAQATQDFQSLTQGLTKAQYNQALRDLLSDPWISLGLYALRNVRASPALSQQMLNATNQLLALFPPQNPNQQTGHLPAAGGSQASASSSNSNNPQYPQSGLEKNKQNGNGTLSGDGTSTGSTAVHNQTISINHQQKPQQAALPSPASGNHPYIAYSPAKYLQPPHSSQAPTIPTRGLSYGSPLNINTSTGSNIMTTATGANSGASTQSVAKRRRDSGSVESPPSDPSIAKRQKPLRNTPGRGFNGYVRDKNDGIKHPYKMCNQTYKALPTVEVAQAVLARNITEADMDKMKTDELDRLLTTLYANTTLNRAHVDIELKRDWLKELLPFFEDHYKCPDKLSDNKYLTRVFQERDDILKWMEHRSAAARTSRGQKPRFEKRPKKAGTSKSKTSQHDADVNALQIPNSSSQAPPAADDNTAVGAETPSGHSDHEADNGTGANVQVASGQIEGGEEKSREREVNGDKTHDYAGFSLGRPLWGDESD